MKREEAIRVLRDLWCFQKSERYSDREIREACEMAIEVLKDQRPHGEWGKRTIGYLSTHECSNCGFNGNWLWKFCPNCGAKMKGGESE